MATQAYYFWVSDGKPWANCKHFDEIQARLQAHGFVVYDYPSLGHQQASYPEDHTAYSYTGWPIDSPYGKAFALDIMPRSGAGRGMPELTRLARQIIADKDAGMPGTEGIKYINWTDEQGRIWQTSWKPNKATKPNSDAGHIHLSGRSDSFTWSSKGYDPFARMNGILPPAPGGEDETMRWFANADREHPGKNLFWFGDAHDKQLVTRQSKELLTQVASVPDKDAGLSTAPGGILLKPNQIGANAAQVRGNCDGMGPEAGAIDYARLGAEIAANLPPGTIAPSADEIAAAFGRLEATADRARADVLDGPTG